MSTHDGGEMKSSEGLEVDQRERAERAEARVAELEAALDGAARWVGAVHRQRTAEPLRVHNPGPSRLACEKCHIYCDCPRTNEATKCSTGEACRAPESGDCAVLGCMVDRLMQPRTSEAQKGCAEHGRLELGCFDCEEVFNSAQPGTIDNHRARKWMHQWGLHQHPDVTRMVPSFARLLAAERKEAGDAWLRDEQHRTNEAPTAALGDDKAWLTAIAHGATTPPARPMRSAASLSTSDVLWLLSQAGQTEAYRLVGEMAIAALRGEECRPSEPLRRRNPRSETDNACPHTPPDVHPWRLQTGGILEWCDRCGSVRGKYQDEDGFGPWSEPTHPPRSETPLVQPACIACGEVNPLHRCIPCADKEQLACAAAARSVAIEECAGIAEKTQPTMIGTGGTGGIPIETHYQPNPYAATCAANIRRLKVKP